MLQRVEVECDPIPGSVRHAREFVAATLATWDMDDLVDVAELLTSELVTNAVLHARTSFTVVVEVEPPVARVEVHDGAPVPVTAQVPPHDSEHGRGLVLVETLASEWGSRVIEGGKAVWFLLTSSMANTRVSLTVVGA